jgi:hypothetical protein
MTLFHSLPPVPPRGFVVNNPVKNWSYPRAVCSSFFP